MSTDYDSKMARIATTDSIIVGNYSWQYIPDGDSQLYGNIVRTRLDNGKAYEGGNYRNEIPLASYNYETDEDWTKVSIRLSTNFSYGPFKLSKDRKSRVAIDDKPVALLVSSYLSITHDSYVFPSTGSRRKLKSDYYMRSCGAGIGDGPEDKNHILHRINRWHLWYTPCFSMYPIANTRYWWRMAFDPSYRYFKADEQAKSLEHFKSTINWGAAPLDKTRDESRYFKLFGPRFGNAYTTLVPTVIERSCELQPVMIADICEAVGSDELPESIAHLFDYKIYQYWEKD